MGLSIKQSAAPANLPQRRVPHHKAQTREAWTRYHYTMPFRKCQVSLAKLTRKGESMTIDEIYESYVRQHDTDTDEAELALGVAGDDDKIFDLIAAGLDSKYRAGFIAGLKVATALAAQGDCGRSKAPLHK